MNKNNRMECKDLDSKVYRVMTSMLLKFATFIIQQPVLTTTGLVVLLIVIILVSDGFESGLELKSWTFGNNWTVKTSPPSPKS